MFFTESDLRSQVQKLAELAFNRQLISGYGDGEYVGKYQIMYQGKPRHLPLTTAYFFLNNLLDQSRGYSSPTELATSTKE
jgi:hypothetical protein